jgi:hypothetical protein
MARSPCMTCQLGMLFVSNLGSVLCPLLVSFVDIVYGIGHEECARELACIHQNYMGVPLGYVFYASRFLRGCAWSSSGARSYHERHDRSLIDTSRFRASHHEDVCLDDLQIIRDFVSVDEEASLMDEIEPLWKRQGYQESHFDSVIHHYRETQKSHWKVPQNIVIMERMQQVIHDMMGSLSLPTLKLLPTHVLDLAPQGSIDAHIDHVQASGRVVAVLSLLSACLVRFRPVNSPSESIDVTVPSRSVYVQK